MQNMLTILILILLTGCSTNSYNYIDKINCVSEEKGLKFIIYNYSTKEKLTCEKGATLVDNSKDSEEF